MLEIDVIVGESFNDETSEFLYDTKHLVLEHSLISISKWESKWKKPFISSQDKTREELIDYVKCMSLSPMQDWVYDCIDQKTMNDILNYMNDTMTATSFPNQKSGAGNGEAITSELIYFWMTSYNIPFECQKWHLNRLMTLIRVCGIKNQPNKKMSKSETLAQHKSLNAARRSAHKH